MMQLVAMAICGYLGWQRAAFWRWPAGMIGFATLAAVAVVIGLYHPGAGPALESKLISSIVSMIALPAAAYWLLYAIRAGADRRRG